MTAKEYLSQIEKLDMKINQDLLEENKLQTEAMTIRSFDYAKDKVQSSPSNEAPFGKTVDKIVEMEKRINEEIDQLVDIRRRITKEIQGLQNSTYITLLFKHYVECKRLEVIAVEMNYTYDHVRHLHGLALMAFENQYKEKLHTQSHI